MSERERERRRIGQTDCFSVVVKFFFFRFFEKCSKQCSWLFQHQQTFQRRTWRSFLLAQCFVYSLQLFIVVANVIYRQQKLHWKSNTDTHTYTVTVYNPLEKQQQLWQRQRHFTLDVERKFIAQRNVLCKGLMCIEWKSILTTIFFGFGVRIEDCLLMRSAFMSFFRVYVCVYRCCQWI